MLHVTGPSVWRAQDLRDETGRHALFSSTELEALQAAAEDDHEHPPAQATERYARIRGDLETGPGFVRVSGVPIDGQDEARLELLKTLYEPFYWKRHNIDTANPQPWYRMAVFAQEGGAFAVTLMHVLIDRAHAMSELPDLTDAQAEALALVQTLAAEPEFQLRFRQEPGEILLLNNYVTLHSRTEFTDEPGIPGRLLLRAWISVPDSRPLPESWAAHYGVVAAGAVRGGIRLE